MKTPAPETNEQRRRFSRVLFQSRATISQGGTRQACELLDLSLRGALARCPTANSFDTTMSLRLDIELGCDDSSSITLDGVIAHREGDKLGLRCTGIDVDSMTHLRRVIELNAGNATLLNRELGELIADHAAHPDRP